MQIRQRGLKRSLKPKRFLRKASPVAVGKDEILCVETASLWLLAGCSLLERLAEQGGGCLILAVRLPVVQFQM